MHNAYCYACYILICYRRYHKDRGSPGRIHNLTIEYAARIVARGLPRSRTCHPGKRSGVSCHAGKEGKMATWKKETIDKYTENAMVWLTHYLNYEPAALRDLGIAFSDGDKKLGTVLNYSLLPGITCNKPCVNHCFGLIPCIRWPAGAPIKNRARNTALAMMDPDSFLQQLEDKLKSQPAGTPFRPHQDGEFFNAVYFAGVNDVIGNCRNIRAWTYTTRDDITEQFYSQHKRPENFSLLLSHWPGKIEPKNTHGLPEFITLDRENGQQWLKGVYSCPGNCQICLKAGRGCPYGETVQNELRTASNARKRARK